MSIYTKSKNPASGNSTVEGYDYEDSFRVGIKEGCENIIIDYLTNLYANPLKAVVRELLTNALDASADSDESVVIEKKNIDGDKCIFSITDFGVGMSAEQLKENYITYANSSKKDDFGVVGGFGLGSKSPMAIAAQYTVTSCDGKETNKAVVSRTDQGIFGKIEKVANIGASMTKVEIECRDYQATKMMQYAREFGFLCSRTIKFQDGEYETTNEEDGNGTRCVIPFTNINGYDVTLIYDAENTTPGAVVREIRSASIGHAKNTVARIGDISYELENNSNKRVYFVIDVEPGYFQFAPSREELPAGEKLDHLKETFSQIDFDSKEIFDMINGNFDINDEEVNRACYKIFAGQPEYVEKIVGKEKAKVLCTINNAKDDASIEAIATEVFGKDSAVLWKYQGKVVEHFWCNILREHDAWEKAVSNAYDIIVRGAETIKVNDNRDSYYRKTFLVTEVDMEKFAKHQLPTGYKKSDVAKLVSSNRGLNVAVVYSPRSLGDIQKSPYFPFLAGILNGSAQYRYC